MNFLRLLPKENLEAEFFSISGSSFHIFGPIFAYTNQGGQIFLKAGEELVPFISLA